MGIVCSVAWQATYGISSKSLGRAWQQMKSGVFILERKLSSSRLQKTDIAVPCMNQLFHHVGDIMPDGVAINLPSYFNFKLLHKYMSEDLVKNSDPIISYTQFVQIMKSDFPDVQIPKVFYLHC